MAAAKQQLLELEAQRYENEAHALSAINGEIAERSAEMTQRVASASITREVIGRLTQPSGVPLKQST